MAARISQVPAQEAARPPVLPPGEIFCPVGRALDLIGDRWTLVLVRHLLGGARGFQELRVRSGIAPRVLSARLRDLQEQGMVQAVQRGARSLYALTARGRSLEPIVAAVARWWVLHAMEEHVAEPGRFTETSAQSILESLPFLLREDRARGVSLCFEIRLTGTGGGVWTVSIEDGTCRVAPGFADRADVRYTADARVWCGVALGVLDARDAIARERMTKDGGAEALDHYFYQIAHAPRDAGAARVARKPAREGAAKKHRRAK
jgi:DNA-binding HxlR family transcriptional regulator